MAIISPDTARAHCKADPADDALLLIYTMAAQRRAEMMLNRNLYESADALNTARDAIPNEAAAEFTILLQSQENAKITYDAAMDAANAITDSADRARAIAEAESAYYLAMRNSKAIFEAGVSGRENTVYGIVADDAIKAALLLTIGHLFRNREDVVTGQSAPAVEMPNAASNLLWPYTRIRSL